MNLVKANEYAKIKQLLIKRADYLVDGNGKDMGFHEYQPIEVVDKFGDSKIKQVLIVMGNEDTNDYWLDKMFFIDFNYYKDNQTEYEIVGEMDKAGGYTIEDNHVNRLKKENILIKRNVCKDKDNIELYDMWEIFGINIGISFKDFLTFIKEVTCISPTCVEYINGDAYLYNKRDKIEMSARRMFLEVNEIEQKDISATINRAGILYFCNKKKKEEYFSLLYPINGRINRYNTLADLINAVHDEYLIQKGLKKKPEPKPDDLESEYRIID